MGKKIGKEDETTFIGYKVPLLFFTDQHYHGNPHNDATAKLFLEPTNLLVKYLIIGKTAEEAVQQHWDSYSKNLYAVLSNEKEPGSGALAAAIWSNMLALTLIGDPKKTIDN